LGARLGIKVMTIGNNLKGLPAKPGLGSAIMDFWTS
jgi:hypothetical protein